MNDMLCAKTKVYTAVAGIQARPNSAESLFVCLLFYAKATVVQLYHGNDMMCGDEKEKARAYAFTFSRNL